RYVWDPFCGTGGAVLSCATLGAATLGSEIDPRVVIGKQGRTVRSNFEAAGLPPAELIMMDASRRPMREARPAPAGAVGARFDAIVADPPYGVRASARQTRTEEESDAAGAEGAAGTEDTCDTAGDSSSSSAAAARAPAGEGGGEPGPPSKRLAVGGLDAPAAAAEAATAAADNDGRTELRQGGPDADDADADADADDADADADADAEGAEDAGRSRVSDYVRRGRADAMGTVLLDLAARHLRPGGRLVFLHPATPGMHPSLLPAHPLLRPVSQLEQPLRAALSRWVVVMQKLTADEAESAGLPVPPPRPALAGSGAEGGAAPRDSYHYPSAQLYLNACRKQERRVGDLQARMAENQQRAELVRSAAAAAIAAVRGPQRVPGAVSSEAADGASSSAAAAGSTAEGGGRVPALTAEAAAQAIEAAGDAGPGVADAVRQMSSTAVRRAARKAVAAQRGRAYREMELAQQGGSGSSGSSGSSSGGSGGSGGSGQGDRAAGSPDAGERGADAAKRSKRPRGASKTDRGGMSIRAWKRSIQPSKADRPGAIKFTVVRRVTKEVYMGDAHPCSDSDAFVAFGSGEGASKAAVQAQAQRLWTEFVAGSPRIVVSARAAAAAAAAGLSVAGGLTACQGASEKRSFEACEAIGDGFRAAVWAKRHENITVLEPENDQIGEEALLRGESRSSCGRPELRSPCPRLRVRAGADFRQIADRLMSLLFELALASVDTDEVTVTTPEGYGYTGTMPFLSRSVVAVVSKDDAS
ncbi:trm11, partial [Symbiodinium sp. KB8]